MSLAFLCTIDNQFAASIPKDVLENGRHLNRSGLLVMGEDNNTYKKIWKRVKTGNTTPFNCAMNLIVNIWYMFMLNLYLVWFTYFGAVFMVVLQYAGFKAELLSKQAADIV